MTHRPELVAHGVRLGEQVVPLLAGSVHYYHLAVEHWKPALTAIRGLGLSFIDTYVPWSVHERAGQYDFGSQRSELDVRRFLELVRELGLFAIIRPGPHVNAELTGFGIPERVLWDEDCMARSASGSRVVLPIPPLAFPLPSYSSPKFQEETRRWYDRVGSELGHLCYPHGPIVFVQVDNEATLGFRDGVFDQDYHPAQLTEYREFLTRKYPNVEALRRLYKNPALVLSKSNPPERKQLKLAGDLPAALDWAEAQEAILARALERMAVPLRDHFPGALLTHNLPPGWEASVLDPERLDRSFDLVGADYYHRANAEQRRAIFQRTSELAFRARVRDRPCFAAELGVGFPPYFSPHSEADSRFSTLCALAYGIQGFNLYMAVERSRWIGAPIDHTGTPLAEADFYRLLVQALRRTRLFELERRSRVTIVVPRSLRRLSRVLHAFDPLSPTMLSAMTGDQRLGPGEQTLGLASSVVLDTFEFMSLLEHELDRRRIPYTIAADDQLTEALVPGSWTVLLCNSALGSDQIELVERALAAGQLVTLGPHAPERDLAFQPLATRPLLHEVSSVPALLGVNPHAIESAVSAAATALELSKFSLDDPAVHVSVFETRGGDSPRVAFLINPTPRDLEVSWSFATLAEARDALTAEQLSVVAGTLRVPIPCRSVRMLELGTVS
ncbi:MAG TPA: beta-galactosidase [Polyangiaceae bacterium]